MKQKTLTIYLGIYCDEKLGELLSRYSPNAYLGLDYSSCFYAGENPTISVNEDITVNESDIIGLTMTEARSKFPEITFSSQTQVIRNRNLVKTIRVSIDKNKIITGMLQ